jgi:hypothetical protein
MADIKLGLSGSEVTLPPISWTAGQPPELPKTSSKAVEMARMIDGSFRVAIYKNKHSWTLSWGNLTAEQLSTLETINGYSAVLRYQNGWIGTTWYNVVITDFRSSLKVETLHRPIKRFTATMQLREI